MAILNTEAARGTAGDGLQSGLFFCSGIFCRRAFGTGVWPGDLWRLWRHYVGTGVAGRVGEICYSVRHCEAGGRKKHSSCSAGTRRSHPQSRGARGFVCAVWTAAPWLASWFGIANGTFLFRIAAIDLPFFGAYTAYRAIHQGHRRFFQLGCSQVIYAFTKLAGVLLLVRFGLSVESALLVNVAATIVGLAWLLPGGGLRWQGRWLEQVKPLVSAATPMGFYYFVLGCGTRLFFGRCKS